MAYLGVESPHQKTPGSGDWPALTGVTLLATEMRGLTEDIASVP